MDRIRVGIVGTGWIARDHLRALGSLPEVEVAAVCDVEAARAEAFAADAGARAYADWRELLDNEELGALFVCTPPLHHREPAVEALRRGLALYLEKPIARSLADAAAIVEAADESGAVCAIGYQWHAVELLDNLAAILADEETGLLVGTSIGPTASRPWFLDRVAGGGNLLERGSHHLDLVRAVGGEVSGVQAAAGRVRLARSSVEEGDIDDAVSITLELASGGLATIVVAWTAPGQPGTYALDVVSSSSTLRLELDPSFTLTGSSKGQPVSLRATTHPFDRSVRQFLRAAREGDPSAVFCTPANAEATLSVAVAAERALETGEKVKIRAAR
ncbi:MAG: Gfo/Idh/MocA family protein [Acidimicrobiales bacterium]